MTHYATRHLLPALTAAALLISGCGNDEEPAASHEPDWTLLSDTPASGLLPAGAYGLTAYGLTASKIAVVEAPEGFSRYDDWTFVTDEPFQGLGFMTVDEVYGDPCAPTLHDQVASLVDPGPMVQGLADALAAQPGVLTSEPVPASVDGYQGLRLDYRLGNDAYARTCPDGTLPVLTTGEGDWVLDERHERASIWILDVDGERLVLSWVAVPGVTRAQRQQLTDMVDSTRFADPS
jgi:hypothetical protein